MAKKIEKLLNFQQIQDLFEKKASAKHARFVPAYKALEKIAIKNGGKFKGDHIALRTTDERVAKVIKAAGSIMNLNRSKEDGKTEFPYKFPSKLLKSFDLLGEDFRTLALFVSVWDEDETKRQMKDSTKARAEEYKTAIRLIKEDVKIKWKASEKYYKQVLALVKKGLKQKGLNKKDAIKFVDLMVNKILTRNGQYLKKETFDAVAKISGELASAMVLGEGINHFTVDIEAAGFKKAEQMRLAANKAGMKVLPETTGRDGWLQQSATIGEMENIKLLGKNGKPVAAKASLRFMEFIHRPVIYDKNGKPEKLKDGTIKKFARFEGINASKIFAAARVD